ncbi:RNA 2',3'-cyclic phosphodiesterase [Zobellella iuensis]|uniref:RNA 2',3'-cyclic phosphodiesterase n=1 Tax=Zobellella iuensis TaxID=2803811 RepID=A0ABS1QWH1_9GAMM|nr:RNA 2',3'-cyclic phosphodiesterase [Zobellella iuensis]MBL1378982.1 RNA 2',3'-cyclic phosphodiesterase [Zobellella iuensis]
MNESGNRLFLAFPADELAPALGRLQDWLALPGRRIPAHQLHMTLRFFGQTEPSRQAALVRWLGRHALPAFSLRLDRLGCFPRAGVVWTGPGRVPEALARLADELGRYCAGLKLGPPHRAFRPHVTLFRHCAACPLPKTEPLVYRPRSLGLYRSIQTEQGPHYELLRSWPLRE